MTRLLEPMTSSSGNEIIQNPRLQPQPMPGLPEVPKVRRAGIVGICGCTNAGKSTITARLVEATRALGYAVTSFAQDDFYKLAHEVRTVPSDDDEIEFFYHYDEPEAVDAESFVNAVAEQVNQQDFIFIDGNMLCELPAICDALDIIAFFTITKDACIERRATRNYDPPDKPGYFEQIVWPAYESHLVRARELSGGNKPVYFFDGTNEIGDSCLRVGDLVRSSFPDLVRIQQEIIDPNLAVTHVTDGLCGAISTFIGTTRADRSERHGGSMVKLLTYDFYPSMAYAELRKICTATRAEFPSVKRIAIVHKVGVVEVARMSCVIATSAPHRPDAINATSFIIDKVKASVPIFKEEVYSDDVKRHVENREWSSVLESYQKSENGHENGISDAKSVNGFANGLSATQESNNGTARK